MPEAELQIKPKTLSNISSGQCPLSAPKKERKISYYYQTLARFSDISSKGRNS
jgi:hypothetical protein